MLACGGPGDGLTVPGETASTTPTPPPSTTVPAAGLRFDGPAPRNLLMLSVDTLRRDRVGRYDPRGQSLTPFLDGWMDGSYVLDDLTSCSSWTVPATACVLSGADDLDRAEARGMVPILLGEPLAPIPRLGEPGGPTPMLPFWLGEHGYETLLVTANGYFSRAWGNAQGYETVDYRGPTDALGVWRRAEQHLDPAQGGAPLGSPWFLHLHFFEPHRPYLAPEPWIDLSGLPPVPFDLSTVEGQEAADAALAADPPVLTPAEHQAVKDQMRARYDGEVRWFDDNLRQVWDALDASGLLDDTLVVFWSDHGEELWEHGPPGHAWMLHHGENRAVAWFWSKNLEPGSYQGPAAGIDLAPTVLAALGLPIPEEVTGLPVGTAPADRARFALVDGYYGPVQSVRVGDRLMHFRWSTRGAPGAVGLGVYDTAADPTEATNRFDPAAPTADDLAAWDLLLPKIRAAEPFIADDPRGFTIEWPEGLPH